MKKVTCESQNEDAQEKKSEKVRPCRKRTHKTADNSAEDKAPSACSSTKPSLVKSRGPSSSASRPNKTSTSPGKPSADCQSSNKSVGTCSQATTSTIHSTSVDRKRGCQTTSAADNADVDVSPSLCSRSSLQTDRSPPRVPKANSVSKRGCSKSPSTCTPDATRPSITIKLPAKVVTKAPSANPTSTKRSSSNSSKQCPSKQCVPHTCSRVTGPSPICLAAGAPSPICPHASRPSSKVFLWKGRARGKTSPSNVRQKSPVWLDRSHFTRPLRKRLSSSRSLKTRRSCSLTRTNSQTPSCQLQSSASSLHTSKSRLTAGCSSLSRRSSDTVFQSTESASRASLSRTASEPPLGECSCTTPARMRNQFSMRKPMTRRAVSSPVVSVRPRARSPFTSVTCVTGKSRAPGENPCPSKSCASVCPSVPSVGSGLLSKRSSATSSYATLMPVKSPTGLKRRSLRPTNQKQAVTQEIPQQPPLEQLVCPSTPAEGSESGKDPAEEHHTHRCEAISSTVATQSSETKTIESVNPETSQDVQSRRSVSLGVHPCSQTSVSKSSGVVNPALERPVAGISGEHDLPPSAFPPNPYWPPMIFGQAPYQMSITPPGMYQLGTYGSTPYPPFYSPANYTAAHFSMTNNTSPNGQPTTHTPTTGAYTGSQPAQNPYSYPPVLNPYGPNASFTFPPGAYISAPSPLPPAQFSNYQSVPFTATPTSVPTIQSATKVLACSTSTRSLAAACPSATSSSPPPPHTQTETVLNPPTQCQPAPCRGTQTEDVPSSPIQSQPALSPPVLCPCASQHSPTPIASSEPSTSQPAPNQIAPAPTTLASETSALNPCAQTMPGNCATAIGAPSNIPPTANPCAHQLAAQYQSGVQLPQLSSLVPNQVREGIPHAAQICPHCQSVANCGTAFPTGPSSFATGMTDANTPAVYTPSMFCAATHQRVDYQRAPGICGAYNFACQTAARGSPSAPNLFSNFASPQCPFTVASFERTPCDPSVCPTYSCTRSPFCVFLSEQTPSEGDMGPSFLCAPNPYSISPPEMESREGNKRETRLSAQRPSKSVLENVTARPPKSTSKYSCLRKSSVSIETSAHPVDPHSSGACDSPACPSTKNPDAVCPSDNCKYSSCASAITTSEKGSVSRQSVKKSSASMNPPKACSLKACLPKKEFSGKCPSVGCMYAPCTAVRNMPKNSHSVSRASASRASPSHSPGSHVPTSKASASRATASHVSSSQPNGPTSSATRETLDLPTPESSQKDGPEQLPSTKSSSSNADKKTSPSEDDELSQGASLDNTPAITSSQQGDVSRQSVKKSSASMNPQKACSLEACLSKKDFSGKCPSVGCMYAPCTAVRNMPKNSHSVSRASASRASVTSASPSHSSGSHVSTSKASASRATASHVSSSQPNGPTPSATRETLDLSTPESSQEEDDPEQLPSTKSSSSNGDQKTSPPEDRELSQGNSFDNTLEDNYVNHERPSHGRGTALSSLTGLILQEENEPPTTPCQRSRYEYDTLQPPPVQPSHSQPCGSASCSSTMDQSVRCPSNVCILSVRQARNSPSTDAMNAQRGPSKTLFTMGGSSSSPSMVSSCAMCQSMRCAPVSEVATSSYAPRVVCGSSVQPSPSFASSPAPTHPSGQSSVLRVCTPRASYASIESTKIPASVRKTDKLRRSRMRDSQCGGYTGTEDCPSSVCASSTQRSAQCIYDPQHLPRSALGKSSTLEASRPSPYAAHCVPSRATTKRKSTKSSASTFPSITQRQSEELLPRTCPSATNRLQNAEQSPESWPSTKRIIHCTSATQCRLIDLPLQTFPPETSVRNTEPSLRASPSIPKQFSCLSETECQPAVELPATYPAVTQQPTYSSGTQLNASCTSTCQQFNTIPSSGPPVYVCERAALPASTLEQATCPSLPPAVAGNSSVVSMSSSISMVSSNVSTTSAPRKTTSRRNSSRPSTYGASPSAQVRRKTVSRGSVYSQRPLHYVSRTSTARYPTQSVRDSRSSRYDNRHSKYDNRSSRHENRPSAHGNRLSENANRSSYGNRASSHDNKPSVHENRSVYENRSAAYEQRPSVEQDVPSGGSSSIPYALSQITRSSSTEPPTV